MTPEFVAANQEALDEAEFNQLVNPQPNEMAESIAQAASSISSGLAWFGFWIFMGAVAMSGVFK